MRDPAHCPFSAKIASRAQLPSKTASTVSLWTHQNLPGSSSCCRTSARPGRGHPCRRAASAWCPLLNCRNRRAFCEVAATEARNRLRPRDAQKAGMRVCVRTHTRTQTHPSLCCITRWRICADSGVAMCTIFVQHSPALAAARPSAAGRGPCVVFSARGRWRTGRRRCGRGISLRTCGRRTCSRPRRPCAAGRRLFGNWARPLGLEVGAK